MRKLTLLFALLFALPAHAGPINWTNAAQSGVDTLNLSSDVLTYSNRFSATTYSTAVNCQSSASPAVCTSASAGLVALAAGGLAFKINSDGSVSFAGFLPVSQ